MLLVHKPMPIAQTFIHTHRRHPSAPAPNVVVQPTRTPGLLSISKPPRAKNDFHGSHRGSPKQRPAVPASKSPKPTPAETVSSTKTPETRGRQGKRQQAQNLQAHQQQQPTPRRSSSQAAPSRRRQPSPDPFKEGPAPPPSVQTPPGPKRRQPIPVPNSAPAASRQQVARSEPAPSRLPRRKPVRSTTLDSTAWDSFPICDDMTEAGSRPTTPSPAVFPVPNASVPAVGRLRPALRLSDPHTPPRRTRLPEPPFTAPLSSVQSGTSSFPFPSTTPTPPGTSPKRRLAARTKHLSEGVLIPMPFFAPELVNPRRSRSSERAEDGQVLEDGYFASSTFQNSPSPDELPPPLFAWWVVCLCNLLIRSFSAERYLYHYFRFITRHRPPRHGHPRTYTGF